MFYAWLLGLSGQSFTSTKCRGWLKVRDILPERGGEVMRDLGWVERKSIQSKISSNSVNDGARVSFCKKQNLAVRGNICHRYILEMYGISSVKLTTHWDVPDDTMICYSGAVDVTLSVIISHFLLRAIKVELLSIIVGELKALPS